LITAALCLPARPVRIFGANRIRWIIASTLLMLLTLTAHQSGFAETGPSDSSVQSSGIIPPVSDFRFNQRWINPPLCGKRFWYGYYPCAQASQAMDIERYALDVGSEDVLCSIADALGNNQASLESDSDYFRCLPLLKEGKIPLTHTVMRGKTHWDGQKQRLLWSKMPTHEELRSLDKKLGRDFLGWSVCSEVGHEILKMVESVETGKLVPSRLGTNWPEVGPAFLKDVMPRPPESRKEFAEATARVWRAVSEPFDGQVEGHDGTHYWAIQWPAMLGARSVITENRYAGRNTTMFQAFTRAAGRMGNIPWGYAPGANGELIWGFPPFRSTGGPNLWDQGARGWCPVSPNCWRRMLYYWCMGSAAIIRDEETHRTISDPENDGTWRLNWYGQTVEEVMDFSDRHADRGTPYTPIGVLLAWDNGFEGTLGFNLKAFNRFEYDDGEQMTRELFHRVLYPTDERWTNIMHFFGASSHGDIYDPLRIDTPRGPLPLELLTNYKVLFAVGRQNVDDALVNRLKEYVTQGGALILNVKQLEGSLRDKDFVGVELGENDRKETRVTCLLDGKKLSSGPFTYTPLKLQTQATAIYGAPNGDVLIARHPFGKGTVITVGAHWMLEDEKTQDPVQGTRAHILPMANDMVGRLVKAVLPFEVRGENVAERVLYQVNRKGKGWVISLYNNSGREAFNGAGPEKVWPDHRVDVEIAVAPEITHAVEWISRSRVGILRQNEDHSGVLWVALEPGDVRIVEIQPQDIPPVVVAERVNLALNRPVKASSSCEAGFRDQAAAADHGPEMAVNGNRENDDAWWSKEHCDPKTPQWLEVDLGKVKNINSINTVFMWSEDNQILQRIYQYYVETSVDGKTWSKLFDESKNMMPAHPRGHHCFFKPVEARYVRITTTLNTAQSGGQIVEFEVYGDKKAPRIYKLEVDI
jgi:hypothetical protein